MTMHRACCCGEQPPICDVVTQIELTIAGVSGCEGCLGGFRKILNAEVINGTYTLPFHSPVSGGCGFRLYSETATDPLLIEQYEDSECSGTPTETIELPEIQLDVILRNSALP